MKNSLPILLFASCFGLTFLFSCNSSGNNVVKRKINWKEVEAISATSIYDLEMEIVNTCVQELTPKDLLEKFKMHHRNDMPQLRVYVGDKMLLLDSASTALFLQKGFNKLLAQLSDRKMQTRLMRASTLQDFDSIKVTTENYKSRSEQMNTVGGINFSRIVFSDDQKTAVVIFDFERQHDYRTSLFCAVELKKKEGSWEITNKVCLDKYPLMLSQ